MHDTLWLLIIRLWLWSSGKFVPLATETRSDKGSLRRRIRRDQKEASHGRNPPSDRDPAGALGNAVAVANPARIAHPTTIAHPCRLADPAPTTTDGDGEMMIAGGVRERSSGSAVPAGAADVAEERATSAEEARLPFAGYDRLDEKELKQELRRHSQIELEAAENYERSHSQREAVLNKLRYLRGSEPLPGYAALAAEEIPAALEDADLRTIKKVRSYERKFRARPGVLDEVIRIQRARRIAEPARIVPAYRPASARSRPNTAAGTT
jgi:hypothetical protein